MEKRLRIPDLSVDAQGFRRKMVWMRATGTISLGILTTVFLSGCVETPRQAVMRPIPPPPSGPPPGAAVVVYRPVPGVTNAPVLTVPSTNSLGQEGYEVSSNFVASAGSTATNFTTAAAIPYSAGTPQYEIVPPRPGADFVWRNGFWRWEGTWVWVPGQWEFRPPQVIIVEPGFGFGYHHHFGGPRYYPPRHRRWRR